MSTEHPEVARLIAQLQAEREALAEARRKSELENMDRKHRAEMAELRAQIAARPAASEGAPVAQAIAAIGKDIAQMLADSAARAAQREERMLERQFQVQQESMKQQQEMWKLAMTPKEEPWVKARLDEMQRHIEKGTPAQDMFQMMSGGLAQMTTVMMRTLQQAAEFRASQEGTSAEENPMLLVAREVGKMVENVVSGMKANASRPRAAALAPAGLPPAAVQAVPPPAAVPAELPPGHGSYGEKPKTVLDTFEYRIRMRENPADIARDFIASLDNPEVRAGLEAAGGEPKHLFGARLGQEWLNNPPTNGIYAHQLVDTMDAEFQRLHPQAEDGEAIPADA